MTNQNYEGGLKTYLIPNNWEGNCFGCSTKNIHGLHLSFWLSEKGCFTECTIPDYLCGFDGIVHGGIVTMLLDEVAAWTLFSHLFRFGITLEITARYLKPVQVNTKIRVDGQIISRNKKTVLIKSTVCSREGTLLAEAESKWLLPNYSNLARIISMDEQKLHRMIENVIQPVQQFSKELVTETQL